MKTLADNQTVLTVRQVAELCGVGRTTVGYWIRYKKLHAYRVGRNYSIAAGDLIYFLQSADKAVPPELTRRNPMAIYFKSYRTCWEYWRKTPHADLCPDCLVHRKRLDFCFTAKSESSCCRGNTCSACRFYREVFLPRVQFIQQIAIPAAVYRDLYVWAANDPWADLCTIPTGDMIGMGVERIVHTESLGAFIETAKQLTLGDPSRTTSCDIYLRKGPGDKLPVKMFVCPLAVPEGTFLLLAQP